MIAQGAPRTLRELVEATLALTCADGDVPTVRRLCFAARWAVAELSDGRAGRAFTFNGQHAVYGALDFELMRDMRRFVGMHVDEVLARLLAEADRLDAPVAAGRKASDAATAGGASGVAAGGGAGDAAAASLARSVALAVANALACRVNAPAALEARRFGVTAPADRSFLRPEDGVVLIGAGMLLRESAAACASVDVVDMRPRAALQSLLLDADGERCGPGQVRFHGVEDTEELVARADVVGITGCALENGSLFDIARLPRRAREFVVFGPSAQAPMELLASLGVTRVVASRIVDAESLMEGMLADFDAAGSRSATEGYVVTMPVAGTDLEGKGMA